MASESRKSLVNESSDVNPTKVKFELVEFSDGEEEMEPAKNIDPKTEIITGSDFQQEENSSVLCSFVTKYLKPMIIPKELRELHRRVEFVEIHLDDYENYFKSLYGSIARILNPDSCGGYFILIDQLSFEIICCDLMRKKVTQIYSAFTDEHFKDDYYKCRLVPRCLAELINDIGIVYVNNGSTILCPKPRNNEHKFAKEFNSMNVRWNYFDSFVSVASVKGLLHTSFLKNDIMGRPWWALTARSVNCHLKIANENDSVIVKGHFKEFTHEDALKCAIVQNQYHGPSNAEMNCLLDGIPYTGILGLREVFNLKG